MINRQSTDKKQLNICISSLKPKSSRRAEETSFRGQEEKKVMSSEEEEVEKGEAVMNAVKLQSHDRHVPQIRSKTISWSGDCIIFCWMDSGCFIFTFSDSDYRPDLFICLFRWPRSLFPSLFPRVVQNWTWWWRFLSVTCPDVKTCRLKWSM